MTVGNKKSQVTIFLIIGVVMIIVVVTLVLVRNFSVKKTLEGETIVAKEIKFGVQPIKNFVEECLFIVSRNSLEADEVYVKERLESFVMDNIDTCLDFTVFEQQGLTVSKKEPRVEASINENDVSFKMTYPIIIDNPISTEKTEIQEFFIVHKT